MKIAIEDTTIGIKANERRLAEQETENRGTFLPFIKKHSRNILSMILLTQNQVNSDFIKLHFWFNKCCRSKTMLII